MSKPMTADDILPLIAELSTQERARLIRLITGVPYHDDGAVYAAIPPNHAEFSSNEDLLAWEGDGWANSSARSGNSETGEVTV